MGTWGYPSGGGQTEEVCTGEKQKSRWGRPFQSAYRGWSDPAMNCGCFEVDSSLSTLKWSNDIVAAHHISSTATAY